MRRRRKFVSALVCQLRVVEARIRGEHNSQARKRRTMDALGRQVGQEQHYTVRPWLFERGNGWYVRRKSDNAAFVDSLEGVAGGVVSAARCS